ncbi:MAG: Oligopeptide-binding protein OppA [Chlamydiia bacterium]|nr:Oligopeptide-binding protein OppA [Chlamydiia bacterium]MCH9615501.1 Oligopeptide-binding protein OppA [Chlamydiia bacterium]MCH9629156.1 Oligopeptide-binding protein OppA [Chlamydiia bacterium]
MKYLYAFAVTFLLLLGSCCKNETNTRKLRVNLPSDPATLDPRRGADIPSSTVHFMLFEGLTRDTPDPNFHWGVAKQVDISDDKLTYTFTLRGALWSDGRPVTAMDFEYAWKTMLAPDFPCPNANLLYVIKNARAAKLGKVPTSEIGVKAKGPRKLVVTLEAPTPYFLDLTSFCVYSPVPHYIAKDNPEWFYGPGDSLPSNGPFILDEWKPGNCLHLTRNPLYWKEKDIEVEEIEISLIDDEATAYEMFEKGELDILGTPFTNFPIDAAPTLIKKGVLDIQPAGGLTFCTFNTRKPPFNNKHIRKAFSYALDRESIVGDVTLLKERPAGGLTPPSLRHPSQPSKFAEYSIIKAKKHLEVGLKELGMTIDDLQGFEMVYTVSGDHKRVAQAIQEQWMKTLGVKVSLRGLQHKIFMDTLVGRSYDIGLAYLLAQYADQMNIFDRFKYVANPKNYPGWEHPEYIHYLDASMVADSDEERFALLSKAEKLILDDMPLTPVFYWTIGALVNPKLHKVGRSKIGSMLWEGVKWRE